MGTTTLKSFPGSGRQARGGTQGARVRGTLGADSVCGADGTRRAGGAGGAGRASKACVVEVVGVQQAAGAWRHAWRTRAGHVQTTVKAKSSERMRLINVNARSNAHRSSLFVNMRRFLEDLTW